MPPELQMVAGAALVMLRPNVDVKAAELVPNIEFLVVASL